MKKWIARMLAALTMMAAAGIWAGSPQAAPPGTVDLTTIRYADLGQRVKDQKGRVVVVDFWADYCAPCKREFPKLVELNRKYSASGLTCISVCLDDPADEEARERVMRFLNNQKAVFANFLLNEPVRDWQKKLKIDGPPCVFVFNRRGELVQRFHDDVDYQSIERIAADALKEQP